MSDDAEKLLELQQLLRERTEELDNLRWRQQQSDSSQGENVVMVLNQQLNDVREENKRLREKLKCDNDPDDLTALKGIGDKLAEQLAELGITSLKQIAALDVDALEDEKHVLHAYRTRVVRDDWIAQARAALKD